MTDQKQLQQESKTDSKEWPRVAVVILNWNGWQDTLECLESVRQLNYPNHLTIVVDNGSWDASLEKIRAWVKGMYLWNMPRPIPIINYMGSFSFWLLEQISILFGLLGDEIVLIADKSP